MQGACQHHCLSTWGALNNEGGTRTRHPSCFTASREAEGCEDPPPTDARITPSLRCAHGKASPWPPKTCPHLIGSVARAGGERKSWNHLEAQHLEAGNIWFGATMTFEALGETHRTKTRPSDKPKLNFWLYLLLGAVGSRTGKDTGGEENGCVIPQDIMVNCYR